jgi:hypothetical protein
VGGAVDFYLLSAVDNGCAKGGFFGFGAVLAVFLFGEGHCGVDVGEEFAP